MRVLISGAGIAGPTLAYWLARYGFQPTIVERAPKLRTGGYIIDFWGAGFDIAERMELLPEIRRKGYMIQEVRVVDSSGRKVAGFPTDGISQVLGGRFLSLPRGDLAATIFCKIESSVETIFDDSVCRIEQDDKRVRVTFERGEQREFDLVIGADGLHSRVRELVFGAEQRFEKHLGYMVAGFEADGYRPRDELVYLMFTELGQQVMRFSMRDDRSMFLFTFADREPGGTSASDLPAQKALLRSRFGNSGWECPRILERLDASTDLYFDRVSQIRMDAQPGLWTHGRVSLIGDAASCVSLLAGQGSALAMVAAYILAGELHRADGDYARAFASYQALFAPFVRQKQEAALRLRVLFGPKSKAAMFIRNQVMNLVRFPWIARTAFSRDLVDKITLPDY
ncbi:MAG TPA: FAD-binding domain [Bryobacteraceae bacterium]|nr:FAD-binding domain [Bryobacteraceae bacterium]